LKNAFLKKTRFLRGKEFLYQNDAEQILAARARPQQL
jgi:hypothetical protein